MPVFNVLDRKAASDAWVFEIARDKIHRGERRKVAISEDVAAAIFVRDILGTAQKSWANVKGELATMTSVSEIDERMGPFDFALAGMAVQMQAPRNLFARGQAKRLEDYVLTIVGVGGDPLRQASSSYLALVQLAAIRLWL